MIGGVVGGGMRCGHCGEPMRIGLVDTLLVAGLLINLLKGADLILRKRQKEWLEDRFETLTLRLDDLRPLSWFGALARPRPAAIWSAASVGLVFSLPPPAMGGALLLLVEFWVSAARNLYEGGIP